MLYCLPELLASWFQRIFPSFSQYESMGANDPQDIDNLDIRGMVCKIYEGDHKTLLYKEYISCGSHAFRFFFHLKTMDDNGTQCVASLDPRGMVGMIYVGDH